MKKCVVCGKLTTHQEEFSDDWDEDENGNVVSGTSYLDFCHEECLESLQNKFR